MMKTLVLQADTGWMLTVRLAGEVAVLDGLRSEMQVDDLLQRSCLALGVEAGTELALWRAQRLLRSEDTLADAALFASGEVHLQVVESGGMPGNVRRFLTRKRLESETMSAVSEAGTEDSEELKASHLAPPVAQTAAAIVEAEVQRSHSQKAKEISISDATSMDTSTQGGQSESVHWHQLEVLEQAIHDTDAESARAASKLGEASHIFKAESCRPLGFTQAVGTTQNGKALPLDSEYIELVIERMLKDENKFDAERRKKVLRMKTELLGLKLVIESRLMTDFSQKTLAFDANLDDNEVVLLLMHEVDKDGNGAISKKELLASSLLNTEMKDALLSAFECDLEAVEEDLAHLNETDFGENYRREKQNEGGFDLKASVRALFDSAVQDAAADAVPSEVCRRTAGENTDSNATDKSVSCRVTKANLERLACKIQSMGCEKLSSALSGLASKLMEEDIELDFFSVKSAALRVPRVKGQRMEWARGVGLDAALARHLRPGTLEDGLAGVRAMSIEEVKQALAAFQEEAKFNFLKALLKLKTVKGSKSVVEANSKFNDGFVGSFANLKDFHTGVEASLELGYPNPETMKGICNEHMLHPSAERLFVTPNYRIATSLLIEYAWAMFEESPGPETTMLLDRAHRCLRKLACDRGSDNVSGAKEMPAAAATTDAHPIFPGEVGDSFWESLVILNFPGIDSANLAFLKKCEDLAKRTAEKLLKSEEEKARGVTALNALECMEQINRSAFVIRQSDQEADNLLRVGILLPMSSSRARAISDDLCAAVAEEIAANSASKCGSVLAEAILSKKWAFCVHTGVDALRRWLDEQSLEDLLKATADCLTILPKVCDEHQKDWNLDSVENKSRSMLCDEIVKSFVRTELRADLRAALKRSASKAQIEALLRGWTRAPLIGDRVELAEKAAELLDLERWYEVEGWVQLYQGRIQGRTRLGIKGLMNREKEKIKKYGLKESEVLGLYLYSGPEFVPINGICRSYPPAVVKLLQGTSTIADNRMCTTLFCISSALKKLSQTTALPECRFAVLTYCTHQWYLVCCHRVTRELAANGSQ